ncbi:MAG: hypothetical protein ACR2KK_08100 [Acidimicrobiales bacterium]
MARRHSPLGALGRGMLAGAAGTAAMDLVVYRRYRRDGGARSLLAWEFSAGLHDWDGAPAPAHVGKRVVEGLFQVTVDPQWARTTNNVMHWAYGLAWGAQYGLVAGSARVLQRNHGLLLGQVVFSSGYVVLPLAKLYKPIWEYDGRTLARDLSAHLVYGLVTGETFRLLSGRGPRSRRLRRG